MSKAASKASAPIPDPQPAPAPAPIPVSQSSFKFAIEDNVPLPTKRTVTRGETAYPFAALAVNQSFFVPMTERMQEPWKTLTSMASRVGRELHPKRFTSQRTKLADGTEGVRVWRVADTDKPLAPPKKINRKARKDSTTEKERLAAEAAAGDTSNNVKHHQPDFEGAGAPNTGGNPPPPPPPAPPAA